MAIKKKKKEKKITKVYLKRLEKRALNKKDKEWAIAIKERDKVCILCGRDVFLHTHHIIPREIKECRHVLDNGVLLCAKHHKFSRNISPHKSPFIFYNKLWEMRPEQLSRLLSIYSK